MRNSTKKGSGGMTDIENSPAMPSGHGFGHDSNCGAGEVLKSMPSFRRFSTTSRWRPPEFQEAQDSNRLRIILASSS